MRRTPGAGSPSAGFTWQTTSLGGPSRPVVASFPPYGILTCPIGWDALHGHGGETFHSQDGSSIDPTPAARPVQAIREQKTCLHDVDPITVRMSI